MCLPGRNSLVNEVGFLGLTYYQKVVRTNETVALPLQKRNFNLYFEDLYRFQMGFVVIFFNTVSWQKCVLGPLGLQDHFSVKRWGHCGGEPEQVFMSFHTVQGHGSHRLKCTSIIHTVLFVQIDIYLPLSLK